MHWSRNAQALLSFIGPELHSVATTALLCHKEPAPGTKTPLLGAFLAFHWFFMA